MSSVILSQKQSEGLNFIAKLVDDAGGQFAGVQDALLPNVSAKLMFTHRETGSLLSVPITPLCFDGSELFNAVRDQILAENTRAANRTISVKVSDLRRIANTLSDISEELNALCAKEKRK